MIRRFSPHGISADAALSDIWREHHRYLLNVAYRMLGSVSEAEDIVQDAFAKLLRVDLAAINDVRGWLVVVVTRLCLNQLRSARARHEAYTGPWLPEPVIPAISQNLDPAEQVTLDDSVRMAMLLVLERLSPAERAAFVLHDVFLYSFDEVATMIGRTPAATRQLASRARRHVHAEASPARFKVDSAELARVTDGFIAAATNGDMRALMRVLEPNVVSQTDSGGVRPAPRRPIIGQRTVAQQVIQFVRAFRIRLVPIPVNGGPGALAYQDDHLMAVISLTIRDGLIHQLNAIANPAKLGYVSALLDTPTVPAMTPLSALSLVPSIGSP
jgi:RNA polymerase sigma-70 factor (ECF subfamily)